MTEDTGDKWEGLEEDLEGLRGGRTDDWYGGNESSVSIEDASEKELDTKKALDDQVDMENRGYTPIRQGLPPCKRVNKKGTH